MLLLSQHRDFPAWLSEKILRHPIPSRGALRRRPIAVYVTWLICILAWMLRYFHDPIEVYFYAKLKPFRGATHKLWTVEIWNEGTPLDDSPLVIWCLFVFTNAMICILRVVLPYGYFIACGASLAYSCFASKNTYSFYHLSLWATERAGFHHPSDVHTRMNPSGHFLPVNVYAPPMTWHILALCQIFPEDVASPKAHNPFHLSRSSISELDQVFALFSGTAVFLYWCWGAFQPRMRPGQADDAHIVTSSSVDRWPEMRRIPLQRDD
ncbi:hypothetical protein B0J13DRAFT_82722 [Dactylonectria estremocensis]|uniref:Uncharacterized protein n=1 Tax=Dactylonectria estremocensis TaxID=1079267 RepID=A0A9P9EEP2_9HYPO|nr:hypothetical protein B0J13DRAFT_82722 [Dactylonectria estremocensis]